MLDLFDGSADLRRYERTVFIPRHCEIMAVESYPSYTLTRLLFEGRDTYLFMIKSKISVVSAGSGTFAYFISSGASLVFSVGGMSYLSGSNSVQLKEESEQNAYFAGFDSLGNLRLIPGDCTEAADNGVVHGAQAFPFLLVNGKRLAIKDEIKRSRDRLILAQMRTGEPAFIYIKGVDVARAADYAFQLGCMSAAVVANERRIDIYGKGLVQDRQSGCKAVFEIK